jgi:hypothetical protein
MFGFEGYSRNKVPYVFGNLWKEFLPQMCKYKDVFGKPNTGSHRYRIFDLAIIDILFTVIAAYLISVYFRYKLLYVLVGLFLTGIIFHRIFCVRTTIDKLLFPNV